MYLQDNSYKYNYARETRKCKCCGKLFTPEFGHHDKALLSISEAAEYLGVTRPTIYARILPLRKHYNHDEWYDAAELMQRDGLTRKYISYFIRRKGITCQRQDWTLLSNKEEWDKAKLLREDIEKNYFTVNQAKKLYRIGNKAFYDGVHAAGLEGIRQHNYMYYPKSELDHLFKDKTPKIPPEIRRYYISRNDAIKHYHFGTKRFTEETEASGVTKVKTEGHFVWYKKSELDKLFKKISDQ